MTSSDPTPTRVVLVTPENHNGLDGGTLPATVKDNVISGQPWEAPRQPQLPLVEQLVAELEDILGKQHFELRCHLQRYVHGGGNATSTSRDMPRVGNSAQEQLASGESRPSPSSRKQSDDKQHRLAECGGIQRQSSAFSSTKRESDQRGIVVPVREGSQDGLPAQPSNFCSSSDPGPSIRRTTNCSLRFLEKAAARTWEDEEEKKERESVSSEISMDEVIVRHKASSKMIIRTSCDFLPSWMRTPRKGDSGWRADLLRATQHWGYEVFNALLILFNALLTAWETEHAAQARPDSANLLEHFEALMYVFCFFFTADLALRMVARGVADFVLEKDWKWNVFDIVVVLGSIVEVLAYLLKVGGSWLSNASLLRVIRLVRVARIVRALRSFVYFRDLRITVAMLCDAVLPLITFSFIMAMIFMVFAIFFTDGATGHMTQHGDDDILRKYYGGLFVSMSTLYMAISGGLDWENAATPLKRLSSIYLVVFYCYVTFSMLAMLNVISAIFIDNTLQRSKNDRDFVVQAEMEGKRDFLNTMDKVFDELDPDHSGTIRLHELQSHIMDPKVNAYFRAIDLNVFKVTKLFNLMDKNGSGDIDKKEFTQGCARLRGEAKELDVAILQYEVRMLTNETVGIKNLLNMLGAHIDERFDQSLPIRTPQRRGPGSQSQSVTLQSAEQASREGPGSSCEDA